jgi:hypothetical protein
MSVLSSLIATSRLLRYPLPRQCIPHVTKHKKKRSRRSRTAADSCEYETKRPLRDLIRPGMSLFIALSIGLAAGEIWFCSDRLAQSG